MRVVNADTEQELCRLTLAESGGNLKGRVVVTGRLHRVGGAWQFQSVVEPRHQSLLPLKQTKQTKQTLRLTTLNPDDPIL